MVVGRRSAVLAVVATLALVVGSVHPVVSATADAGPTDVQEQPATDDTVTRIQVYANGTARWTVHVRTRLTTDTEVEQYRAFQAEFRNDTERYLAPFRDRIQGVVREAATETGREMTATDFAASTTIQQVPRRWGVVTYEFTWTQFARRDGNAVVVGDVFAGGLFLAANDSLVVEAPTGYEAASVDPAPTERDDGDVSWTGRVDFADGRPRVRYVPAGASKGTGPGSSGIGGVPTWVVAGVLLLLAVGLAGLVLVSRGGLDTIVPTSGPIGGGSDGASGAGSVTGGEPMTDGDRVRRFLEERDGQARQAAIAEAFDWSASKTSRVVSDLADEDRVEKLRIGRENIISLPVDDE